MRKKLAAVGLTAGLAAGAVAGFAFTANSGLVSAQDDTTTTTVAPADAPKDGERPDRSARLQEVLQPLVDDGTLTQAQADKVIETLVAAGPGGQGDGGFGRGGHGGGPGLDLAATALGMTADELMAELQAGKTIAAVATEKGIDLSVVVDAMVAEATERINQQVADGKITQAEADEKLSTIEERITAHLNGERPEGAPEGGPGGEGFGGPGFGGPGHHGRDDGAASDDDREAPPTTAATGG